jgi:hypothetical protein
MTAEQRLVVLEAELARQQASNRDHHHMLARQVRQQATEALRMPAPQPPSSYTLYDLMTKHHLPVTDAQRGLASFRLRYGRWLNPHTIAPADATLLLIEVQNARLEPRQFVAPPAHKQSEQLLKELRREAEVLEKSFLIAEMAILVFLKNKLSPIAVTDYKERTAALMRGSR